MNWLNVIFLQHIVVFALMLLPQLVHSQTRLNPPRQNQPQTESATSNADSGTLKADSTPGTGATSRPIGVDAQGRPEFSVLEYQSPIGPLSSQIPLTTTSTKNAPIRQPAKGSIEGSSAVDPDDQINRIISNIVLNYLPHQYVDDKKWGKQSKRFAGIRFRRDGAGEKLETKRKHKMVNHGTWRKYAVSLTDADRPFSVYLDNVRQNRNGITSFDVGFTAKLNLDARQSKWVKGIQLYSISAQGNAEIGLLVSCELAINMDWNQFPPDLILSPKITKAEIDIESFKLDRISKAGGEFAQQATRFVRRELNSKIAEKEKKLVKKINDEIQEHRDDLRLSVGQAGKLKWFDLTKKHLPTNVKNSIEKHVQATVDNNVHLPLDR